MTRRAPRTRRHGTPEFAIERRSLPPTRTKYRGKNWRLRQPAQWPHDAEAQPLDGAPRRRGGGWDYSSGEGEE